MRAHFGLPSVESDELEAKRPVTVNFEIPYFTVSGIQVQLFMNTHFMVFCLVLLSCVTAESTLYCLTFTHECAVTRLQILDLLHNASLLIIP